MNPTLSALGLTLPVLAAPLGGGPTTPDLVIAAAKAGSLGFLAGGYKTADLLAEQIATVRSAGVTFGVNLFAPNPVPVDPSAYRDYAHAIADEGKRYGVDLVDVPIAEDDDRWRDKIDLLLADPVPLASFTFGIPEPSVIAALRAAGTIVTQTVTSAEEARRAAEAGVDALALQSAAAGGHSGTLTPDRIPDAVPITELIAQVRSAVPLPLIAAGGLATPGAVAEVLAAGAAAVMVGTVLLRSDEAATSAPYRAALADPSRTETLMTRAFTGRPARALRNLFTDRYSGIAPAGYPAVHYLTSPMRKAAAAGGDPERINVWAGTGFRHATAEPAGRILTGLAASL
jgi:NAD(P)H-dependent flavin oxidoreductase YrpB (nitropropane dioxygenase family)